MVSAEICAERVTAAEITMNTYSFIGSAITTFTFPLTVPGIVLETSSENTVT